MVLEMQRVHRSTTGRADQEGALDGIANLVQLGRDLKLLAFDGQRNPATDIAEVRPNPLTGSHLCVIFVTAPVRHLAQLCIVK